MLLPIFDYTPFLKNKLILKPELTIPNEINEYGMYMIDNYDKDSIMIGKDRNKKVKE